jgi:hypothetical protein
MNRNRRSISLFLQRQIEVALMDGCRSAAAKLDAVELD